MWRCNNVGRSALLSPLWAPRRSVTEKGRVFISEAPRDPMADAREKGCPLPLVLQENLFFGRLGGITTFATAKEKAGKDGKLVQVSNRKLRPRIEMRVGS